MHQRRLVLRARHALVSLTPLVAETYDDDTEASTISRLAWGLPFTPRCVGTGTWMRMTTRARGREWDMDADMDAPSSIYRWIQMETEERTRMAMWMEMKMSMATKKQRKRDLDWDGGGDTRTVSAFALPLPLLPPPRSGQPHLPPPLSDAHVSRFPHPALTLAITVPASLGRVAPPILDAAFASRHQRRRPTVMGMEELEMEEDGDGDGAEPRLGSERWMEVETEIEVEVQMRTRGDGSMPISTPPSIRCRLPAR
ncbi:hypothetical protein B0H13DRAFT_2652261 [Mycena leptocephala]|nr:hypothetical protein B0H13DRAFT_2652261 [Mycena leptocephala]